MAAEAGLPVTLDVAGKQTVVVGGGPVAARKIAELLDARAGVRLVAPEVVAELADAASAARLTWVRRQYEPDDLDAAWLVLAATGSATVNSQVAADAAARRLWCIRVDGGEGEPGSAALAAAVRHDPLVMTVSTGGAAPALAARIRAELAESYGSEYGALARLLGELREDPAIRARLETLDDPSRRAAWRRVLDADILNLVRSGHHFHARKVATACLFSSSV